jgi:hypothetical protein
MEWCHHHARGRGAVECLYSVRFRASIKAERQDRPAVFGHMRNAAVTHLRKLLCQTGRTSLRGQQPIALCRPAASDSTSTPFSIPSLARASACSCLAPRLPCLATLWPSSSLRWALAPSFHVVLVLDQAGWHRSRDLVMPEGLTLVFLPPYSPELQPAECAWALSGWLLANRVFASLDDLEAVLSERCCEFQAHSALVAGRARSHWWPQSPLPTVA